MIGIGFQIKSALRERGMTLRQLADETGISYNTLYAVTKRDSKRMDCVLLSKISAALDLPVSYFTGNIERAEPNVVRVVRCKDCKHCLVTSSNHGGAAVCNRALPTRPLSDYFISGIGFFARVNPDDYCSHGERRTDD